MSDLSAFPFSQVKSVKEIEALADTDFIRCAYLKILGREPDPTGGRHYLSMIRRGYSKLTVLARLSESEEARGRVPVLDGIDQALATQRRRSSNWGRVSAAIMRNGDDPFSRRRRAFWNFLDAQYASMDRLSPNRGALADGGSDSTESAEASSALIEAIEVAVERSAAEPVQAMRQDIKARLLRIESLLLRRGTRSSAAQPEQTAASSGGKANQAGDRPAKRV